MGDEARAVSKPFVAVLTLKAQTLMNFRLMVLDSRFVFETGSTVLAQATFL